VLCLMQFFLQSNPFEKSLHTMKPLYPLRLASHNDWVGPLVCWPAAFGVSGLAERSSLSEFADAIADDRQIEVIGIE
jgi:hypothetical protein